MYLCIVLLFTTIGILQNGITAALPSTTASLSPQHRQPQKYYAKMAQLINMVNKINSNIETVDNVPINDKNKNKKKHEAEIDGNIRHSKKEQSLLKTVMHLLQKNYDADQEFGQQKLIRVHYIKNPEVIEKYKKKYKTHFSPAESSENYFDRELKDVLRRNSIHFRLANDGTSDDIIGDPDEVTVTRKKPESVEETTQDKLTYEYDEIRKTEMLSKPDDIENNDETTGVLKTDEVKDEVILVDDDLNLDVIKVDEGSVVIEDGQATQDGGTWDVITTNYKWGDEAVTEKSLEEANLENANRRETKDSLEDKKDNSEKFENINSKDSNSKKKSKDWDSNDEKNSSTGRKAKKWDKNNKNQYKKFIQDKNVSWDTDKYRNKKEHIWEKKETKKNEKYYSRDVKSDGKYKKINSWEGEDIKDSTDENKDSNKKRDRVNKYDYYDKRNMDSKDKRNKDYDWDQKITKKDAKDRKNNDERSGLTMRKRENGDIGETKKKDAISSESFERKEIYKYKPKQNKKKTNEWDSYVPKFEDHYHPRLKRVDARLPRLPPPIGGHAFGRTPIPFVGKKRIYDE